MIIRNATMAVYLHESNDNVYSLDGSTSDIRHKAKLNIPCQVVPTSLVAPSFSRSGAPIQKQGCEILVEARHLEEMKRVDTPCPFKIYYTLDGTAQNVSAQCIAIEYLRAVNQYKLTCIQERVY